MLLFYVLSRGRYRHFHEVCTFNPEQESSSAVDRAAHMQAGFLEYMGTGILGAETGPSQAGLH